MISGLRDRCLAGVICGGNVPARIHDGKRHLTGPVPRTIKAVGGKYNLQKEGGGAATLNTAPPWITPGKMGVQGWRDPIACRLNAG